MGTHVACGGRMQLGAEFVGTFILIFFATAAPIVNQKYGGAISPFGNAACAGLAVTIIILSTGHISGAHLNPSLTIAFAALRHFPWLQVPAYVAVQVLGSICASFALKGVFHPFLSGGVTVPDVTISTAQAFFTEFIISFNLLFVVTAVATDTRAVRTRARSQTLHPQCRDIDSALNCSALDLFLHAGG